MIKKFLYIFFLILPINNLLAKSEYIKDGIELYDKNKLEDAKFKFEQDIVCLLYTSPSPRD